MKINKKEFERIKNFMPIERKPAKISNQQFLNALLYIIENGCKWRALPKKLGNWHTIYVRFNRWAKNGTMQRIFQALQEQNIVNVQGGILCLDSTSVKVHPDACGARKTSGKQSIGRSKGGLTTKIHAVCASEKFALKIQLSAGNCHDAPEGRKLIESLNCGAGCHLVMDRAYEDNKTRATVIKQGLIPVVPPKKNRKTPWKYDTKLYKCRNQIERFFLRIKRFRKVFARYQKFDIIYLSATTLALIFDAIFM